MHTPPQAPFRVNGDSGARAAFDRRFAEAYPELLRISRGLLRSQRPGHPFERTDLVHEAYLKLVRYQEIRWRGPGHLVGAVTQTMRRLLIDHARAASALKRAGVAVPLEGDALRGDATALERSDWTDLLACLAREHPRWAHIVECRCVRGLTIRETADEMNVSECTVSKHWRRARQWMRRELNLPRDPVPNRRRARSRTPRGAQSTSATGKD